MKRPILICINSLRTGGTERVVSILLEHLKNDFDIHLALYNNVIEYPIPPDTKIFQLGQVSPESNFLMLLKGPLLSYRLNRYCRENRIETVVAFLNRACYLCGLMKKMWRSEIRVIMCQRTHQSALVEYRSFAYRFFSNQLLRMSFSQADVVLSNSAEITKDLELFLSQAIPVKTIHNPLDLREISRLSQKPAERVFENGFFHFIVVGGLRREKNHSLLLKAFSKLKKGEAKLWIIGGGTLEEDLRAEASSLGLSPAVEFCGFIANPFPYLVRANCLILPSLVEGFPNALLEALACGKPVISTDCFSGPREILDPRNEVPKRLQSLQLAEYGILVPVEDSNQLTEAMNLIMTNTDLQTKYASKSVEAVERYDIECLKKEYIELFSSDETR